MGSATSFMQVEMYHVEAHVTRASNAEYRVGIGSIIVELSTNIMHHRRNLQDIAIEKTQSVRVGHHNSSNVSRIRVKHCFEMLHVDTTGQWISFDLERFVIGKSCACRIGTMRIISDSHEGTMPL